MVGCEGLFLQPSGSFTCCVCASRVWRSSCVCRFYSSTAAERENAMGRGDGEDNGSRIGRSLSHLCAIPPVSPPRTTHLCPCIIAPDNNSHSFLLATVRQKSNCSQPPVPATFRRSAAFRSSYIALQRSTLARSLEPNVTWMQYVMQNDLSRGLHLPISIEMSNKYYNPIKVKKKGKIHPFIVFAVTEATRLYLC